MDPLAGGRADLAQQESEEIKSKFHRRKVNKWACLDVESLYRRTSELGSVRIQRDQTSDCMLNDAKKSNPKTDANLTLEFERLVSGLK